MNEKQIMPKWKERCRRRREKGTIIMYDLATIVSAKTGIGFIHCYDTIRALIYVVQQEVYAKDISFTFNGFGKFYTIHLKPRYLFCHREGKIVLKNIKPKPRIKFGTVVRAYLNKRRTSCRTTRKKLL